MAQFPSVAAALGLAVCAMQLVSPHPAHGRVPVTHTVTIEGARFEPDNLTIVAGDTVVWINQDPFPHTVTSAAAGFDSKTIAASKTWRFRPTKAGQFSYLCTIHPTMTATLRIK